MKQGYYVEAVEDFDKAIYLEPIVVKTYIGRGNAKTYLGHYDEAVKDYDKAIQLNSNFEPAFYHWAATLSLKGQKEEMLNKLARAIKLGYYYKNRACKDENFKRYWGDPEFIELTK